MYANYYYDDIYETTIEEGIAENLISGVESSFKKKIGDPKFIQDILEIFYYAWDNEDPAAEKIADSFGFGQEHLYAVQGKYDKMMKVVKSEKAEYINTCLR